MVKRLGRISLTLLLGCDSGGAHHAPVATKAPIPAPADARSPTDAGVAVVVVADAAAPPPPPSPYSCTSNDADAASIAHMLLHGLAAAPCVELPASDRATQEHSLAANILARGAAPDLESIQFAWGCTSHGDTPVVVDYSDVHDNTGAEVWAVRAGKARRLDSVSSGPPDEYSSSGGFKIGPAGDFDGDGAAESIIESWHHASAHGTTFMYRVVVAGALRTVPSDVVVRAANGDRDGVVRTLSVVTPHSEPCKDTDDPNTKLDCELAPGAGFVRTDTCGPWDWEKHAPDIFVLGAGKAFVALPSAAATKIITATAADRAALP